MGPSRRALRQFLFLGAVLVLLVLLLSWAGLPGFVVIPVSTVLVVFLAVVLVARQDEAPPIELIQSADEPRPVVEPAGACRACGKGELELLVRVERRGLPHGADGHEYVCHTSDLFRCTRCASGQLVVTDHDCWSSYDADDRFEEWDLAWDYGLDAADTEALMKALGGICPEPRDPLCRCAGHQGLRSSALTPERGRLTPIVLRMKDGAPTLESRCS